MRMEKKIEQAKSPLSLVQNSDEISYSLKFNRRIYMSRHWAIKPIMTAHLTSAIS